MVYETSNLSKEEVEKIIQSIEPEVTLIENKKSKSKKMKKAHKIREEFNNFIEELLRREVL